jgi:hypothetical protein
MQAAAYRSASAARLGFLILSSGISSLRNLRASFALSVSQCFHLRPGSSDLGLVASNAFHYFFKMAADRRLRMAGLFSNRDLQVSKLFIDVDELETNVSTERIYMRTHGEPPAGIHPTPPALLCRVETETSEARQICEKFMQSNRASSRDKV